MGKDKIIQIVIVEQMIDVIMGLSENGNVYTTKHVNPPKWILYIKSPELKIESPKIK